jgi:hypothetical protein
MIARDVAHAFSGAAPLILAPFLQSSRTGPVIANATFLQ